MAYELAKAYVQVVPTTKDIKKQLSDEIVPEAENVGGEAGRKSGKQFGSYFGSAAKIALKSIGVITTAAVAGMAALTKSAVESYAEYEQLVGGVETLFKDSSDVVQSYAAEAYKTAGLSYLQSISDEVE